MRVLGTERESKDNSTSIILSDGQNFYRAMTDNGSGTVKFSARGKGEEYRNLGQLPISELLNPEEILKNRGPILYNHLRRSLIAKNFAFENSYPIAPAKSPLVEAQEVFSPEIDTLSLTENLTLNEEIIDDFQISTNNIENIDGRKPKLDFKKISSMLQNNLGVDRLNWKIQNSISELCDKIKEKSFELNLEDPVSALKFIDENFSSSKNKSEIANRLYNASKNTYYKNPKNRLWKHK